MADDNTKTDNNKKCSKSHMAKLELSNIIVTLFKNFVILSSIFLILHIQHHGGPVKAFKSDFSQLGKGIYFIIILTLMLTFLSIIDVFIYNNLMLGMGLGMGVAVVILLYPNFIRELGNEAVETSINNANPI